MESRSIADAARAAQRQMLEEFMVAYDEVDAAMDDWAVVEQFLDSHGVEYRDRLARVEQELAPAVQILRRSRGKGLQSIAVEGITARILTALKLLKGEV